MDEFAFATVDEFEARYRRLSPNERTRAELLLADATVKVIDECGDNCADPAWARLASITVCDMVRRAFDYKKDIFGEADVSADVWRDEVVVGGMWLHPKEKAALQTRRAVVFAGL